MDNKNVDNLREALQYSPDNIPLRLHLADTLFQLRRYDEAAAEYEAVISLKNHHEAKWGLARVSFELKQWSKSNVILEELIHDGHRDLEIMVLYARTLVKENMMQHAVEVYQEILAENPGFSDEELDLALRVRGYAPEDDDNAEDDFDDHQDQERFQRPRSRTSPFMERPSVTFKDVGGMDEVKKEIGMKIIQPLLHPEIYKAYGKKTGGGILLYGPPGCGKTFLAKATAGEVKAKFISVGLNEILDMWIGNSEKNLHEIFETARKNTPCVLFFDEIDALGASRSDMRQSAGRHLINQFLSELDGLTSNNDGVLVMGATNTPWHLDAAFRRPGRFDRIIFVPPPDTAARAAILELKLAGKPAQAVDCGSIAKNTEGFSGADLDAVIDIAVEEKLEESFRAGSAQPITTKDLAGAVKKHRPTISEWFTTAKNFALYANDSGLYDDILHYLKIRK